MSDFIITMFGDEVMMSGSSTASWMLSSTATRAVFETVMSGDGDFSMEKDEVIGWT